MGRIGMTNTDKIQTALLYWFLVLVITVGIIAVAVLDIHYRIEAIEHRVKE